MQKILLPLVALPALLAVAPAAPAALAAGSELRSPTYLPYGDATGAWSSGSVLSDGSLAALVRDGAGQPLWALDAALTPDGQIQGSLLPLEYAGNPVLKLGTLAVTGSALLSSIGGDFHLVMYDPKSATGSGAGLTIFALGFIQGELIAGRPSGALPLVSLSGRPSAGHQAPGITVGALTGRWFLVF